MNSIQRDKLWPSVAESEKAFEWFFPGVPGPKGSWDVMPNGKFVNNSTTGKAFDKAVRKELRCLNVPIMDGALYVKMVAVMPVPDTYKRGKNSRWGEPHTVPCDADKIMRLMGDAMTGVIYNDDAQIAMNALYKRYQLDEDEQTGVHVKIWRL